MQSKMHYFVKSDQLQHHGLYLTACGRTKGVKYGSVQPHIVAQSGHACQKCLYRIWREVPYLRSREMEG